MRYSLGVLVVTAASLCATPIAAACGASLEVQIIDRYSSIYHQQWEEMSRRPKVDSIIDLLASDIAPILSASGASSCRFRHTIERALPQETPGGPRLAPDAKAIGVEFEFASDRTLFCIGLNNIDKIGLPPDDRFPHQVREIDHDFLTLQTLHYAMKCFRGDGTVAGYRYY